MLVAGILFCPIDSRTVALHFPIGYQYLNTPLSMVPTGAMVANLGRITLLAPWSRSAHSYVEVL